MAKKNGIYRCNTCQNIVSLVYNGGGPLACCGEDMILLQEKTIKEEGMEKHVPVIGKSAKGTFVKIGSMPHPMEEKHYIIMIQIMDRGMVIAEKRLYPGEEPIAQFCIPFSESLKARELCNLHGLWKN